MREPLIPNSLKAERLAAGIATPEELAERAVIDPAWYSHIEEGRVLPTRAELERLMSALGGIPASQLHVVSWRQIINVKETAKEPAFISARFRDWRDQGRMLVSRDEFTWFERDPGPPSPSRSLCQPQLRQPREPPSPPRHRSPPMRQSLMAGHR